MKRFGFISFLSVVLLLAGFSLLVASQPKDEKIKAFNNSLKKEKNKSLKGAIDAILGIYDANKDDYLVNLRLGWLYYSNGEYALSKKYYQRALEIEQCVEARLGYTYPLSALGEWDAVKKEYEEILKVDFQNYTANLRLGQIIYNAKDYSRAKTYFQKVVQLYPSDYEGLLYLGWSNYFLDKKNDAKEAFIKVLMLNENDSSASEGLALIR